MLIQFIAVAASAGFAFFGSYILLKIVDKTFGLRVSEDVEHQGLDISIHGESAFED